MIVYKWVYKKNNKYHSLMNYGYYRMRNGIKINQKPYELGKTYTDISESENLKAQLLEEYNKLPKDYKPGFYFWKTKVSIRENIKKYMAKLGADINVILKCEIEDKDILSSERCDSIRAKKFKVLEEVL